MKKIITSFALALTSLCLSAEDLSFRGQTDKDPLLYKLGEEIVFRVTLVDKAKKSAPVKGRKLVWERTGDDGKKEKGEALSDEPLVVKTKIDIPGFVRVIVNVLDEKGQKVPGAFAQFDGNAGADVMNIEPSPRPANFDEVWDTAIAKMKSVPMKVRLERVSSPDPAVVMSEFSVNLVPGEGPATGCVAWPAAAADGTLPIKVETPGYGYGRTYISKDNVLRKGGSIVLAITRYGEDPLGSEEYHMNLWTNVCFAFCWHNMTSTNANDQFKMVMRDLRALQFAKTLPQWDGKRIYVGGGSMGGYRSMGLAAFDKDVTSCSAHYSWMTDLAGYTKYKRLEGWLPRWTVELDYIDAVHFAPRITCPVDMLIGLSDYVCPPSGQMILYRLFRGPVTLKALQNAGHGIYYGVTCPTTSYKRGACDTGKVELVPEKKDSK